MIPYNIINETRKKVNPSSKEKTKNFRPKGWEERSDEGAGLRPASIQRNTLAAGGKKSAQRAGGAQRQEYRSPTCFDPAEYAGRRRQKNPPEGLGGAQRRGCRSPTCFDPAEYAGRRRQKNPPLPFSGDETRNPRGCLDTIFRRKIRIRIKREIGNGTESGDYNSILENRSSTGHAHEF